eukprot:6176001-Pleurochrysis_carterae.AAC.1
MHFGQRTMYGPLLTFRSTTGLTRHNMRVADTLLSALIGAWPPAPSRLADMQRLWCSAMRPRTAST